MTNELITGEIRAIKMNSDAILQLAKSLLRKNTYRKFALSSRALDENEVKLDVVFDSEACEFFLFVYDFRNTLCIASALAYCHAHTIEPTNSLFEMNTCSNKYYSVQNPIFLAIDDNRKRTVCDSFALRRYLLNFPKALPGRKEVRIIRLPRYAVEEVLWEHFMSVGDRLFNISEEDSTKIVFHMTIDDDFNELVLCVLNLREFSQTRIDMADDYIRKNYASINSAIFDETSGKADYISVII